MTPQSLYDILYKHYGNLNWWPAKSPYEMIVGAILVQNTNWSNVQKAIANFGDNLRPEFVLSADLETIRDIIRPAGFFNAKSGYLVSVTGWFMQYDFDVQKALKKPLHKLRGELLAVRGIGMETADCILLYAMGLPTFVIDAYTVRLCERLGLAAQLNLSANTKKNYMILKEYFEVHMPKNVQVYNNYHALIVEHGKTYCHKKPLCGECPLCEWCLV